MRRLNLTIALILMALIARAVTLHCEPGKLGSLLNGNDVSELTLTGKMDARDFRTLADRLRGLKTLNLYGVEVVAYAADKALFANVYQYRAHEIPTLSFADMQQLTRLTLPWRVTSLGEGAVAACTSLTEVTLPKNLTRLGNYAFAGCTALQTVALPNMLVEIGEGAFAHCTSLTTVTMQNTSFTPNGGSNTTYDHANCHLATVGKRAFIGCQKLKNITLGNQLKSIGEAAFAGTKLTKAELASMSSLNEIGNWAFAQTPITSASLPSQISELGHGAFLLTPSLTSVALPFRISNLPPLVLAGSDRLTEVDMHQLLIDSIGDYSLYGLDQVQHLTIPITTKYVGTRAMAGMTGLQSITTYAQSVPDLGEAVWQGVDQANVMLLTPGNSVDYYSNAEQWREFIVQSNVKLGDVNGDGIVDIADLNAVINYMIGRVTGTFIFEAADIDQNGYIDIGDVNGVINIMLGTFISRMPSVSPDTGDALVIDNIGINVGERHTVDIHLDNSRDYNALQCVIHLPEGLELVDGTVVAGGRNHTHKVASRIVDNDVAIILYAMPNVDFGDDKENAVLRLTVTATDELTQVATLVADHVMLVTADGESYHAPSTSAQVSRMTGVDELSASADRVYGANGTLHIVAQQASTAQLVALNGMTRRLRINPGDNAFHNIDPGVYIVRLNGVSHKVKL